MRFEFDAELWRYTGEAAWYFVTLPVDVADEIEDATGPSRRGFGSVPVEVSIGSTTWRTSIFPDKASQSFVLPVKKEVRRREDIDDGSTVSVTLTLDVGAH